MSTFLRWRITGVFTLVTPMHLGNGEEEENANLTRTPTAGAAPVATFVAAIARDAHGAPFLPGNSIKGALGALCVNTGVDEQTRTRLFGALDGAATDGMINTIAGRVEFCNAYLSQRVTTSQLPHFTEASQTALIARNAIDRDYGTAVDEKLFYESVVPPGAEFAFEVTADGLTSDEVAVFLGLLEQAAHAEHGISFGGGVAREAGRVQWTRAPQGVQCFDAACVDTWLSRLECEDGPAPAWWSAAQWVNINATALGQKQKFLRIPITLNFHTPFLVNDPWPENGKPDGEPNLKPRKNHPGIAILPQSGMHGALRSQAERILRTVGVPGKPGYAVPAYIAGTCFEDLVTVLFGASGWRSIVAGSDFTVIDGKPFAEQEFVAIDRFTGGGKDAAKFKARHVECPTLRGHLTIDLARLQHVKLDVNGITHPGMEPALGLLALLLRDLDEGDIAFGYGKSKGYGRCSKGKSLDAFKRQLAELNVAGDPLHTALASLRDTFAPPLEGLKTNDAALATTELATMAPVETGTTIPPVDGFHNPYTFLPVNKPDNPQDWHEYSTLPRSHHSHAQYHARTLTATPQQVFNGRIVCELKTKTPIFIGGRRQDSRDPDNIPATVCNSMLNGNIVLPATSLRGALSSLGEAISQSTMRVLTDPSLFDQQFGARALPKVGKVIKGKCDGKTIWMIEEDGTGDRHAITKAALDRLRGQAGQQTEAAMIALSEGQKIYFDAKDRVVKDMAYFRGHSCSPADLMFGFVEDGKLDGCEQSKAFMSKVVFGYGRLSGKMADAEILAPSTVLKILAAPKPPSPALYFKRKPGSAGPAYISKLEYEARPKDFDPQGRKVYLHALRDRDRNGKVNDRIVKLDRHGLERQHGGFLPWQSASQTTDAKQKVSIQPIVAGTSFFFEVDFINLSESELQTLCATLRPHPSYEHKIGMGKPIGLGSVTITPVGMFLIDRSARYRGDALGAARYHGVWKPESHRQTVDEWPSHLADEAKLAPFNGRAPGLLAAQAMAGVPETLRHAIVLSGDPKAVIKPVHYPQLDGLDIEVKTFEWFSNNDKDKSFVGPSQALLPITPDMQTLQVLKRTRRRRPEKKQGA